MKAKGKQGKQEKKFSLVGVKYRTSASVRKYLVQHLPIRIRLEHERDNIQDANAIAAYVDDREVPYHGMKLGYLRRQVAAVWAPALDSGTLTIHKAYLYELDPDEGIGELLITLSGNGKSLVIGP